MIPRAEEKRLRCWSGVGAEFGRYDYRVEDHRLEDILNDEYFGTCVHLLRNGDMINIVDLEDQIMMVRVDHVDRGMRRVLLSKIERLHAFPVVTTSDDPEDPGLVWRWRSRLGGGHSIMNKRGEVVAVNYASREEAEQAIKIMYENKTFSPKPEHAPTKQFVRTAPIAK
jgi:hypothetical protein